MSGLPPFVFEEFRASAIPDRLTIVNVQWIEGGEAVRLLSENGIAKVQKGSSYLSQPAKRILERYQFARKGGWVAHGCTLDGGVASSPYFKPSQPRKELGNGRIKAIKYETPLGCEALPLTPFVDNETAQRIYQRCLVKPLEGETFWQVVYRCNLPIAITEGLKKALSLIAHGLPAIALRGITCWHKKGSAELHEAIGQFTSAGRSIYVIFDQDEKASTQRDVRIQALKLSNTLEDSGCKVFIPCWDSELGKGIDDVLMGQGESAQAWLDDLLKDAPTLNDYKRHGRVAAALAAIDRLNRLSYPVGRETEGEYLPKLPEITEGAMHVLTASMNAGKTTRIGTDWVRQAIKKGWNVLVLAPLNSLGQQTANSWGLPHIHSFGTSKDEQGALWSMVSHSHGIVMCPDSLHRLPGWFWQRPLLLVLDEANQTIEHTANGDTLGNRWSDILEKFAAAARHALISGAIVLSEDGLPDRAVKFVQSIVGCESDQVRVIRHRKQGHPWSCTVFNGSPSGYRARLLEAIREGTRLLVVTSSQCEAERLERAIDRTVPGRKVVRIDSETNQQGQFNNFFDEPNSWLKINQPDVLILSPSAKSGVSIEGGVSAENAYFQQVWGYFSVLATDTHMQLLGRYRPSVPRFIYTPNFILGSAEESLHSPRAIKSRLERNLKGLAGVYGLKDLLEAEGDRAESIAVIETAVLDYIATSKTVSGSQKSIARDALVRRLEASGHRVEIETIKGDKGISELWTDIQEEIWREDAGVIAVAEVEDCHTPEWARKTLDSLEASAKNRTIAHKVLWRQEFPGVAFDDAEECYKALCQDYGAMRRGVLLQAKAENILAAKEADRASFEAILRSDIRALHRLPKSYIRALLITKTGILELLNGQTYNNSDPRAIAVKKTALQFAGEISYWLRLQIKPDQTPVEICNKLLKKLGLEGEEDSRPGRRTEKRDRVYVVAGQNNPVRLRLMEALRRKLSGSVSTICNGGDIPSIQIVDTPSNPPPVQAGEADCEPRDIADRLCHCETDEELRVAIERFSVLPRETKQSAWEMLKGHPVRQRVRVLIKSEAC